MGFGDREHVDESERCDDAPQHVKDTAAELHTMIDSAETTPINVDQVVADLGFAEDSPEANFLQESLTGLNDMMVAMNEEEQQKAATLPGYFTHTGQMRMTWDAKKKHLTVLSQGQEVMKFSLERKVDGGLSSYEPVPGNVKTLGISMKNLLIAPDTGKDNEVDLNQFMSFATEDGVASDWGLETFGSMYMDDMGYLATYEAGKKNILQTQQTKNIVLGPQQSVRLTSPRVNSAEVTVNSLFGTPNPFILEVTSPTGEVTVAYLQKNGTYLTAGGVRPRILQNSIIKNATTFEDMQLAVENNLVQNESPKRYTRDELFPDFVQKSPAMQQAITTYMATFPNNEIELETNTSGMRTYVDMLPGKGYILHYELNNAYFNQPYNTDLTMSLTGVLQYTGNQLILNKDAFRICLAKQVQYIVSKNFMQIEKASGGLLGRENFTTVKSAKEVYSNPKKTYTERRTNKKTGEKYKMTLCSEAARETVRKNFGIQVPDGNSLDAINKQPIDNAYVGEVQLSGTESLADIGTQRMYDLLSSHLAEGCTVVDIGYTSTGTNGKRFGHRNFAYYAYDTQERYIIDPVANYGGRGLSRFGIPLREAQSKMFSPYRMRFYKSTIGVYDEDEGAVGVPS